MSDIKICCNKKTKLFLEWNEDDYDFEQFQCACCGKIYERFRFSPDGLWSDWRLFDDPRLDSCECGKLLNPGSTFKIEGDYVIQHSTCNDCGKEWIKRLESKIYFLEKRWEKIK